MKPTIDISARSFLRSSIWGSAKKEWKIGRRNRRPVEHRGVGQLRLFDHRVALVESTEGTGTGLVATADIPQGTVVWMSDSKGELTSCLTREELVAPDGPLAVAGIEPLEYFDYCWVVEGKYFHGPKIPTSGSTFEEAKRADATNFINHSCSPTLWFDGDHNMTARVDISAGEAVTYDYCMSDTNLGIFPAFACHCGSDECRGALTTLDFRRPALQHKYAGHFLSVVSQAIARELALPASPERARTARFSETSRCAPITSREVTDTITFDNRRQSCCS